jgi:hypothetical protein
MNNDTTTAPGVDPAISQLHTLITSPIEQFQQMDMDLADQSVRDANPPAPHNDPDAALVQYCETSDAFLTDATPRGALPTFWQKLFPTTQQKQAQRMYTRGDGSCGKGAVLLAIASPCDAASDLDDLQDLQPLSAVLTNPAPLVHSTTIIQSFFDKIREVVDAWSEEEWCSIMPSELRDDVWCGRPRCAKELHECQNANCACPYRDSARSPELELTLFRDGLKRLTSHQGPAFFFVVAFVTCLGILVITDDKRLGEGHIIQDYHHSPHSQTMILYFCHRANHNTGHYETVGVFPLENGTQTVDVTASPTTLFELDHWLPKSLRSAAEYYSSPRTLDTKRITYLEYSVPSDSNTPPLAELLPSTQTVMNAANPRSRRQTKPPARLIQHEDALPSVSQPRNSRRRLTSHSAPHDRTTVAQHAPEEPRRRTALPKATAPPAPVTAAPRHPNPVRPAATGAQLQVNMRTWIRANLPQGRMVSRVHSTAVPTWTNQCRAALQQLAAALQKSPMDEDEVVCLTCVLWLLPAAVFSLPGRSRGGARGRRNKHNRIHRALEDRNLTTKLFASLMCEEPCNGGSQVEPDWSIGTAGVWNAGDNGDPEPWSPAANDVSSDSSETDEERYLDYPDDDNAQSTEPETVARAAQRVEGHLRAGHLDRALRALTATSAKADTRLASERALLKNLHPPCPSKLPLCPATAPEVVVDLEWMSNEMAASDTGAAPGPSGWGSNMLSVLAADTHCVTALALIIQFIVNNNVPRKVCALLTTSSLVSLVKDDRGGRRPLAVGEMLYRLAARYALFRVLAPAQKALRPHQYGVGEQDGCTQVVQSLQHLLTQPPTSPPAQRPRHQFASASLRPPPPPVDNTPRPLACLSIDITNAFNTINRAAVLKAAYANDDLRPSWRMLAFAYGQTGWLLMKCGSGAADNDAFIQSENGVRQGDPLSSLLFSIAMRDVYSAIAKRLQAGCYAFIDDSHGVGRLSECWAVWQELPKLLEPLGLQLNIAKCELSCFHLAELRHQSDGDALTAFMSAGVKVNDRCLKVLGCVVGVTDDRVAEELRENPQFAAAQRVAFQRLPLLTDQTGMIALRYLTGTVLTNRLRAMTPASTAAHAAEYDGYVLRAAHRLVGIVPRHGDEYDTQLRWPYRIGGFGLTAAVEIAPGAYIAGLAGTLASSPAFATVWSGDGELDPTGLLHRAVADSIKRISNIEEPLIAQGDPKLVAQVSASVLPATADIFMQHVRALKPSCAIQAAVTHRISTLSHIAMVTQTGRRGAGGVAELARLNSLTATESSLWLRVLPTDAYLRLSNIKWKWAAQLRLGMPEPVYEPDGGLYRCNHTKAAGQDGWHALTCISGSSTEITKRHNAVVSRLAHFARLINITPRIEPAGLAADDDRRPDIQLDLPDVTLLGDVTISHPLARVWKGKVASRGVEVVGDARETEKDDLYADMAEQLDMEFSAFVLYTHGGFHASAMRFIKKMGRAVEPATCLTSYTQWKQDLMEHIAIAVQRGNADIMIQDSKRRRGTSWPRRRKAGRPLHTVAKRRPRGWVRRSKPTTIESQNGQRESQVLDIPSIARVARMIGLLDRRTVHTTHSVNDVDSDAETQTAACDETSSPLPSIIPETQQSAGTGVQRSEANTVVPSSVPMEEQGAGARPMELSAEAAQDGDSREWAVVEATAVVSMAQTMEDVVEGTTAVHSVREVERGGSCSVKDCRVVAPAGRVS